MQIILLCRVWLRNAGLHHHPNASKDHPPFVSSTGISGFFPHCPQGNIPKTGGRPPRVRTVPTPVTLTRNKLLTPRSGTSQNLLLLSSFFGKCSKEGRAWDRATDSTPGDSTHKYDWGVWEKAAVCHHTFFYLILRRDWRPKFLVMPAWLIIGAKFDFPVKMNVSELPA